MLSKLVGIPRLFWYGINNTHNIMILELLGKSLEDLRIICGGNFSLKTVTLLWYQMVKKYIIIVKQIRIYA